MKRIFGLLALISVTLGGCSTIPLGSIAPLSRIRIETTDLDVFRVALRLPDSLRPRPGGVKLEVVFKTGGEAEYKTTFLMTESLESADLIDLAKDAQPGFSVYAYRLSPDDIAGMDTLRRAATRKRQEGKSASLGFGIATKEFCLLNSLPAGPLLSTVYIWTSETGRYVIASANLNLREQRDIAAELSMLAPCQDRYHSP